MSASAPANPPNLRRRGLTLLFSMLVSGGPLLGVGTAKIMFNLPRDTAERALKDFSVQSGCEVLFSSDAAADVRTNAVKGEFTPNEAVRLMLAGTVLRVVNDKNGVMRVMRSGENSDGGRSGNTRGPSSRGVGTSNNISTKIQNSDPQTSTKTTSPMKKKGPLVRLAALFALAHLLTIPVPAADGISAPGVIEGRVFNLSSGSYLNNARVSIDSLSKTAFTNERGEFSLGDVPAGQVEVRVFFTGMEPAIAKLVVEPGATVRKDFDLSLSEKSADGERVKLDAFVVAASRETNASAIAINEQRFAANIKNVVAADEFGDVSEGNLGEFVKYLPGVTVDGNSWDVRNILVRGFSSDYTAISIDGDRAANAASSSTNRTVEVSSFLSMNNVARVEVIKSPLPDSPADMLGGSVNVITKNAFERRKAQFNYRLFGNFNAQDVGFGRFTGFTPGKENAHKIEPAFDLSYVAPLTPRFGITVNAQHTRRYNDIQQIDPYWLPSRASTPYTTADNPWLARADFKLAPTYVMRTSASIGADWKATQRDVISVGFSYGSTDMHQDIPSLSLNAVGTRNVAPIGFSPTFTQGAATAGRAEMSVRYRRKLDQSTHSKLKWRHQGPIWTAEAGASASHSTNHYRTTDYGYMGATFRINDMGLRFDDIADSTPGRITATKGGVPVDLFDARNYTIFQPNKLFIDGSDLINSMYANLERTFSATIPVTVKMGVDRRSQTRDVRQPAELWNFVGPDGVANSADDRVGNYDLLLDNGYGDGKFYFNLPRSTWVDQGKLFKLYKDHPEYFRYDEANAIQVNAQASKVIEETVSAAYLRADTRLLGNRLLLAGGVRFERTEDEGSGVLNDPSATYQRDAAGNLVRDSKGNPIRITNDLVERARLQYIERGSKDSRQYDHFFPSLNAVFNAREDLLIRAAYGKTIGRPNFTTIIPGIVISDPTSSNPTITLTNPDIKPWTADNFDLSVEYYTKGNGLFSAGVFTKNVKDFFGRVVEPVTDEILNEYGLTSDYSGYQVSRQINTGDASITGYELAFRQSLGFISPWTRGLLAFANFTSLRTSGARAADFSGFVPQSLNAGLSFNRPRYNVKLNWNRLSTIDRGPLSGTNVAADTRMHRPPQDRVTFNFEYRITQGISIFGVVNNLLGKPRRDEAYAPGTPEYSRTTNINYWGVMSSFGIKGEF
ncbi:MAG: TonB-dependent receptor [Opitutaceae bacterium]|nr:TonB-dependent receptor [Opitutaceae bacterium]